MDLVKFLSPKHVILVHGEKPKMATLKDAIQSKLGIPCYDPANNETLYISSTHYVKADISDTFTRSSRSPNFKFSKTSSGGNSDLGSKELKGMSPLRVCDDRVSEGILSMEKSKKAKVIHQDELLVMLEAEKHEVQFANCCQVNISNLGKTTNANSSLGDVLPIIDKCSWLHLLFVKLTNELAEVNIQDCGEYLQVESFSISVCLKDNCPHRLNDATSFSKSEAVVYFCCSWSVADEQLAWNVISTMRKLDLSAA